MFFLRNIFLITGTFISAVAYCQSQTNPLLVQSNSPTAFDKVDANTIREAVNQIIQLSDERLKNIITVIEPGSGPGNTLSRFDLLLADINDLDMKLQLISATYVSDSSRDAADNGNQALINYQTGLTVNERLYKSIKTYSDLSQGMLKPSQEKFLREQIQYFENNGMKLDSAGRSDLRRIQEKITLLGIDFDRNIGLSRDSMVYSEKDLKGVPENLTPDWKRANGKWVVNVNTPNAYNIFTYAADESSRKKMYDKYQNRAYPENIRVLDSLLFYRNQYALKLGYKSYAAYALTNKMAGNPQAVWAFENNLVEKMSPKLLEDLSTLRALKQQMHPELPDTIFAWDVYYYKNMLLDTKYKLNTEEVKEYFEMNQTIRGMFDVYHQLLGITVKEISGWPTWYNKVRSFEMYVGTKKVGSFYFDLYPRQNKFTHFACFPITVARMQGEKEVFPVAALLCNFPEGGKGDPTLLSHSDVVIMFHEFGHLVADMVARSNLINQPYSLKADFVEAPSQFLENFCWQYSSLKIFAKNYKSGKPLPESLFKKMKETENVLISYDVVRQLMLGMVDFTFEDKYDSIQNKSLLSVSKNIYSILQIPYPEGTHFIASFGHLNGYGANYYGYQWSRVFAKDIFSAFEKNGVMDAKTGERYRQLILEVAGSQEEMDMLRNFLGREPNSDAYMRSMGF